MGIGMSTYSAAVVPAEFMAVDEKRLLFSNKMRIPGSPKKRKKIESSETTGSMCGSYGDSTVTPTFDSESGTGLRPSVSFLSLKCDNECSQDNLQSLAALWKTTDSEYFQPYSAKIHRMEDLALKGGDYGAYCAQICDIFILEKPHHTFARHLMCVEQHRTLAEMCDR
jgi:hypothetical protein